MRFVLSAIAFQLIAPSLARASESAKPDAADPTAVAPATSLGATRPAATGPAATGPTATTPQTPWPQNAGVVSRGSGRALVWEPEWRRFGAADGIVAGAGVALGVASLGVGPDEEEPVRGRIAFDESVRDALRSNDYDVRRTSRDASDVLVAFNLAYPFIGDALVNAAWYRESPDVAWQLALIDGQAIAVAFGIQQTVAALVSRERPYGRTCGTDELAETNKDCETSDRFRSYYSGHTSMAFVSAAATCTHHAYVPLHGGRGEWIPCAAGLVIAASVGVTRMGADFHYATDVLTGAAVGSLVGWLVPWSHYALGGTPEAADTSSLRLTLVPGPGGLGVSGIF